MFDFNLISGGLGSFTPSKIKGLDNTLQLGVTQTPINSNNNNSNNNRQENPDSSESDVIRMWPKKESDKWSGQSSFSDTDILF